VPPITRSTTASPEQVFRVLSAPPTYALWVVGSRSVESHHDGWPEPGSRFEHTQGQWPVIIHDETESAVSDPPRRLELIVKARPVLVARVILELRPTDDGGTEIYMEEEPLSGFLATFVRYPPGALLTQLRNRLSLRRLSRISEAVAAVT
jgi:uncharacterized protein YndB with AHSA1/START domain